MVKSYLEPASIFEAMKEEAELYCEDDASRAKMTSSVNFKRVKDMFESKNERSQILWQRVSGLEHLEEVHQRFILT